MADWLPSDLIILYQDAFQYVDTDNDGIITTKMLGRLLRQCGENPSESEIQDLINDVDSDASGFLHFPTFLNMMSKKYVELNAEDEIREAFKVFDSDGNGYITRRELKIVMMNMGEKLSDEEIESIIDDSDLDNDGQINYEEFYIMMNSVK